MKAINCFAKQNTLPRVGRGCLPRTAAGHGHRALQAAIQAGAGTASPWVSCCQSKLASWLLHRDSWPRATPGLRQA